MEGPKIWIGYKKVIETHLRKKVPILLWHMIVMGGGGKAPLSHRPCDTTHYRHKNDENP